MNVACIFITCNRLDYTLQCIRQNFFNAEVNADVILIDNGSGPINFKTILDAYPFTTYNRSQTNQGIAAAINKGLSMTKLYDGVVLMANDILMPQGWLKEMLYWAEKIPRSGMVGIHCVESVQPLSEKGVHETWCPFGNVLITRQAITEAGGFSPKYGLYGMDDSDFGYRTTQLGFKNYYIPNLKAEHIGHDMGEDSAYRKAKDESLAKAGQIYADNVAEYDRTGNYFVPFN
jgi:GT2 family glycosyltransferase